MSTLTTSGIQIRVNTQFRLDLSQITESKFFFNYRIDIENMNSYDVQLLTRDWYIFDSLNDPRYISGEGVIGEQPTLKAGEKYTYTSGCDLTSEVGLMKGFYTFKNLIDEEFFQVIVPTFLLEYPGKQN
jgi:ApaG protein